MPRNLRSSLLTTLFAGALLAGCGGGGPAAQSGPTAAAEPPTAVAASPAPTAAPPAPQAEAPTTAPALADAAPIVAAEGPFAGIPQGRTPEGYPTLGAADAPVTLVMYSDFL